MSDEGVVYFHDNATTVRSVLASATNAAEEYETVIIIVKDKEGEVRIGHSDGHLVEKIGLCSVAVTKFTEEVLHGI